MPPKGACRSADMCACTPAPQKQDSHSQCNRVSHGLPHATEVAHQLSGNISYTVEACSGDSPRGLRWCAGVIAGGAVREILELSGIKNGFGKQLGSDNPLNNARATIDGLSQLRTLGQAAANRNMSVEQMLHFSQGEAFGLPSSLPM